MIKKLFNLLMILVALSLTVLPISGNAETDYDDLNQPPYDESAAPPDGETPTYDIVEEDLLTTEIIRSCSGGGGGAALAASISTTQSDSKSMDTIDPDAVCPNGYTTSTVTYSGTPKINEYISITSYSRNSSGEISVSYKIKKNYSTNEYIQIGYDWPAQYRGAIPNKYVSVSRSTGTYTIKISKPSTYVGRLTLKVKYGAGGGRYSESKTFGSVFHAPTGQKVTYHTVTKAEVFGDFFVYYAVPGVYFNFAPGGRWVKIIGTSYLGWSLWDNFSTRTTYSSNFPHPVEGQYYRITNWYNNFNLYTKTEVWSSKESYNKGVTPSTYITYYSF
ncbi:hypothetical protein [Neobacillus sp. PS2-9]|uniref:hypothetical protein n=1 Tax=Neobacillus sp. PS2-9 TaxID=3070676 RepID=UPI0027DF3077|nr:hypothetical protein [Neobacillus sp. PS2-9]WML57896.1 hypothetical protein RCG25_23945 [Neobacillus sp. PS2-9]